MVRDRILDWRSFFQGIRTRILLFYLFLMMFFAAATFVLIRQMLYFNLQDRIDKTLQQEVEELRLLVKGRDPSTGKPFGNDIEAIFGLFLNRNIPEDSEYLITLLPQEFYRSSPRALPEIIEEGSDVIAEWTQLTQPRRGELMSVDQKILYLAEPVRLEGKVRGLFVVAFSISNAQQRINTAMSVVINVMTVMIIIAFALAFVMTGRVVVPLKSLTNTARAINESDLTKRIAVKGEDEIAELGKTFNAMLDRLQDAFVKQRNFIDDAGHELRTPITIIRGHLDLMGDDPQELQATLVIVNDELDRMSRFVEDIVLLAKAEQTNFLDLDTVDVALLTEELYAKARGLAERDWQLDDKGTGIIVADRQRITQAVMNLAQNATQHTQVTDVIAIGSIMDQDQVRFWVRDTGNGIPLAEQEQIFQRFARGRNRHAEGAGLGLAIVSAIADAHGGYVNVVSQPGKGATFTLNLPLEATLKRDAQP
jgi:signal transduction histidine kinase